MHRHFFFSPFLTFIFLSAIGCRTISTVNLTNRSISAFEVQNIVREHHSKIHTMRSEGRLSIESPEIAQSVSFVLLLQKPDSVLISIRGPFGIKVGSVLVTRSDFLFYNSMENKLISGTSNIENLNRILHIQLSFDDLINLFGGGVFLEEDRHPTDEIQIEDNNYVLTYTSKFLTRRYWINPESMLIQKIQIFDQYGNLSLEQLFADFEETGGITIPYFIRITQPKAKRMLSLTYSDVNLNTKNIQCTLTIPPNAERVHW